MVECYVTCTRHVLFISYKCVRWRILLAYAARCFKRVLVLSVQTDKSFEKYLNVCWFKNGLYNSTRLPMLKWKENEVHYFGRVCKTVWNRSCLTFIFTYLYISHVQFLNLTISIVFWHWVWITWTQNEW